MKKNGPVELFVKKTGPIQSLTDEQSWFPPKLFNHRDLIDTIEYAHLVDQGTLINTLNHIHFKNEHVHVLLQHPKYEESILVTASIDTVQDSKMVCLWTENNFSGLKLEKFQSLYLIVDDGQSLILIPTPCQQLDSKSLKMKIPDTSYALGSRQTRRYGCRGITAKLNQNGFQAEGELMDFSPIAFRVRMPLDSSSPFQWFNLDSSINIQLGNKAQQNFFSGLCRCIRQRDKKISKEIVLTPLNQEIKRFKKRRIRSQRQRLIPNPTVSFNHPLLKRRILREIFDLSTSGFSVFEEPEERVLMPSMIIPDMTICFAGALKMHCTAQVVYRLEEERKIRCGVAILDMDIHTYSHLTHLLTNVLDPQAHISDEVDMDILWKFFFDSGFISPEKYHLIRSHREVLKKTYQKIYQENPKIARHFTYQKNGKIYGHISMLRAYPRAWLIHHHAAMPLNGKQTGFKVLRQIVYYLIDMTRLPSANMDYLMCYFRPEKKFPDRVFGSFARDLNNRHGCSMDLFSYLPYTNLSVKAQLPEDCLLRESTPLDLWELGRFYHHYSGGQLLEAFGLEKNYPNDKPLETIYSELGLYRKIKTYSLSCKEELNAVLIVDQSDLGVNLSELLNSIKVIVTNPDGLPWKILSVAITQITRKYRMEQVPILFFPLSYVDANKIPYEKQYQLWILNVQSTDEYREYLQKKFRMS